MAAVTVVRSPCRPAATAGRDSLPLHRRLLSPLRCDVVGVTRQTPPPDHGVVRAAAAHYRHRCPPTLRRLTRRRQSRWNSTSARRPAAMGTASLL